MLLALIMACASFLSSAATLPRIAAGDRFSLAVAPDGTVYSWGSDEFGQLGFGVVGASPTANLVPSFDVGKSGNRSRIAAGMWFYVAVKANGTVWTWGRNDFGQLGDGTTLTRSVPVQVPGLTDIVAVAAGPSDAVAVKADGTVWAWGRNDTGQLGDTSTVNRRTPVQVSGLDHILAVAVDPVVGKVDGVTLTLERTLDEARHLDVVFDHQEAHGHRH